MTTSTTQTVLELTDTEKADELFTRDDLAGYWYASGRLDQGHPPVIEDQAATTAWHFGRLWARLQVEYRDPHGRGGAFPGIQAAWDNFVASAGSTILHERVGAGA